MQKLQTEIEAIQEENQALERDFENEINKKNMNAQEVGQIINSVNNIYMICGRIAEDKGKKLPVLDNEAERDPNLVENMTRKLETGAEYMEDLVRVLKELGNEYRLEEADKDKYFEFDAMEKRKRETWEVYSFHS